MEDDKVTSVTLSQEDRDNIQVLTMLDINPGIRTQRAAISYALRIAVEAQNKREVAACRAEINGEREAQK